MSALQSCLSLLLLSGSRKREERGWRGNKKDRMGGTEAVDGDKDEQRWHLATTFSMQIN